MNIDPTIMRQLEEAQAAVETTAPMSGPPIAPNAITSDADVFSVGAAGSGQAVHVLLDHYFTNTNAFFWAHAGGSWRHASVTADDEAGIAKVAFEADRVDTWWNSANKVTILRCWKTF